MVLIAGLSPHERGNLSQSHAHGARPGPIPARAGQPLVERGLHASRRAYPRTSGATSADISPMASLMGLSPHERGNLYDVDGSFA